MDAKPRGVVRDTGGFASELEKLCFGFQNNLFAAGFKHHLKSMNSGTDTGHDFILFIFIPGKSIKSIKKYKKSIK